jgi:hypothetical protein
MVEESSHVKPESLIHLFKIGLIIHGYFSCIQPAKPVPEFIDPVFAKTSQSARFLLSENERFGLVFVKTGSINSGTGKYPELCPSVTQCFFFTLEALWGGGGREGSRPLT